MGPPRPTGSRQALSALTARLAGVAPPADPNSQQRSQESKQAGEPRGMRRSPAGALSRTRLPHACCTPGAGRRWPHDEEGSLAKGKQPPPRPSPSSTDPQSAQPPPPVCPVRLPSTACRTRARPAAKRLPGPAPYKAVGTLLSVGTFLVVMAYWQKATRCSNWCPGASLHPGKIVCSEVRIKGSHKGSWGR